MAWKAQYDRWGGMQSNVSSSAVKAPVLRLIET